jgi:hypothetical protein
MDPLRWICVILVFSAVGVELQETVFKKDKKVKHKD